MKTTEEPDDLNIEAIAAKFDDTSRVVPIDAKEVSEALPFDLSSMASSRLARAAMNQACGGDATAPRYQIWAETVRAILLSTLEDIESDRQNEATLQNLRRAINSLGAFCTIQSALEPDH